MIKFERLTKKQKEGREILLNKAYTEILFDGGSRAGKTFLILMYFIILCGKYNGIRLLIARLRFAHAKASIWHQTLIPILRHCFKGLKYKENKQDWIITIGDSEIWLGGLDDKDRVDKILGQEYACIFLNEAVSIPEASRDVVLTRLAQKIDGYVNKIIYDCNPRHPLHYLYQEFYIEKKDYRVNLHWLPEDNLENLPDGYIERLDNLKGDKKKRFRLGLWAALPGAVYENVKPENIIECNKDIKYYDDLTIGVDFGLHSAICIWGIKDNKACCIKEYSLIGSSNTITRNLIKQLNSFWGIKEYSYTMFCDHEPDRIQELNEAGYNAKKALKEVEPGDATVNEYELYFDIECKNTFQSMLNLTHKEDNMGNFIEAHIKENDHEADASRYALHSWKMENRFVEPVFIKGIM